VSEQKAEPWLASIDGVSLAAQQFAEEWARLRWQHGVEAITAGRDLATAWVCAQDLASLFDAHAAKLVAAEKERNRRAALMEAIRNRQARARASAAGREMVATCRQADYETAMRIARAIRGAK
jgi:hypothetical protein